MGTASCARPAGAQPWTGTLKSTGMTLQSHDWPSHHHTCGLPLKGAWGDLGESFHLALKNWHLFSTCLTSWTSLGLKGSARGQYLDLSASMQTSTQPFGVAWGDLLTVHLASGGPGQNLGPGEPRCGTTLGAGDVMTSPLKEPLEAVHISATSLASFWLPKRYARHSVHLP